MEQPLPEFRPVEASADVLASLLQLDPRAIDRRVPAELGSAGVEFLFLPLRSLEAVKSVHLDSQALQSLLRHSDHPAVYVFCTETIAPRAAAHARMFSLLLGSDPREDPATGSAAGPCGAYLVRHQLAEPGRLTIEQGYEMQRPSRIEVEIRAVRRTISDVRVGGGVVKVAEGTLYL
jgi:trans-2,3-dihydro-3-hydroxyanthranilate isomerase